MIAIAKKTKTNETTKAEANLCDYGDRIVDQFLSDVTQDGGKYPVHRTVSLRMDFGTWLQRQSPKNQQIIMDLAYGDTVKEVSRQYGITLVRISELQGEYFSSWQSFINPRRDNTTCRTK